jgi:hypothetical protein
MELVEPEGPGPADEIRAGTRWLLVAFAVLTLLAVNQLFVLADVADRFWAWTIHTEMTAAFIGAAYAAGFVLSVLALRQDRWSRIRIPLITVTAFTVLTAVATLVHAHRLNMMSGGPVAEAAAWIWLGVYLLIPIACIAVVAGQELRWVRDRTILRPMPGWLTALLAGQGAVLFAAGTVLFVGGLQVHHHEAAVTMFWPWRITPLSGMVVGAWLLAFALAAALVIRERDLATLFVSGVTYTVFGVLELVALIWHWPQVDAVSPWAWAYVALLVAVVATGGYGWWASRGADAGRGAARTAGPSVTPGLTEDRTPRPR